MEPEDEHLLFNLVIPPAKLNGAKEGEVVRARVTHYPTAHLNPQGEVSEILGPMEDAEVQTLIVVGKYSLPDQFPPEVIAEAAAISPELIEAEIAKREDMRDLPLVTIDGESARDFDDGVCVEKKPGGSFTLYVAIADVSHYVRPGSALDQEAYQRGTSVYFPQRAVHMLPPGLSTGLCSLNPDVDRLAMVVILDFDRRGRLKKSQLHQGRDPQPRPPHLHAWCKSSWWTRTATCASNTGPSSRCSPGWGSSASACGNSAMTGAACS